MIFPDLELDKNTLVSQNLFSSKTVSSTIHTEQAQ